MFSSTAPEYLILICRNVGDADILQPQQAKTY